MTEPDPGVGLYVHWPFCRAKCPYCDFNSHVSASVDQEDWTRALVAEIRRIGRETPHLTLSSVFFGGGTPSLMDARTVEAIVDAARATWRTVNAPEITLEANPTSVEIDRFRGYAAAGVTRVSIGVQSLRDSDLRRLGRLHSADEARRAFGAASEIFEAASFDLIYARQDQTPADWEDELAEALALSPSHLSLYQLTIESGTAFGDRFARGKLPGLPDEDSGAEMYELTQSMCDMAGLPAYEVSNHAQPGAESRHNLTYWRSGQWVGVGPGAHGRLNIAGQTMATETARDPKTWLASVLSNSTDHETRVPLSDDERATEFLLMGLRLSEGISLARLAYLGMTLPASRVRSLADLGYVSATADRLRVTRAGRPVLNAILSSLLT